jgi:hypothetical protein
MSTTYVIVTIVGAAMVGFSAVSMFLHAKWVVEPLAEYGVPRSWWPWLATVKTAGAVGLAAGPWFPAVGIAAAAGVVAYFLGAVVTVLRARWFTHVPFPVIYMAPAAISLALALAH